MVTIGTIGIVTDYVEGVENGIPNGIFTPIIKKFTIACTDISKGYRNQSVKEGTNGEVVFNNRYSFLAAPNMITLLAKASCVENALYFEPHNLGVKLKITDVTLSYPRVTFGVGDTWHE